MGSAIACAHCGQSRAVLAADYMEMARSGANIVGLVHMPLYPQAAVEAAINRQGCCDIEEPLENADRLQTLGWTRLYCSASKATAEEIVRSIAAAHRPCVAATGMRALPYAAMALYLRGYGRQ